MHRLKELILMVSEEKTMLKVFFPNEEICKLSPLNTFENPKKWHIHDLLDVINNYTKFQLNWIWTPKNVDTAVTLKYNQDC